MFKHFAASLTLVALAAGASAQTIAQQAAGQQTAGAQPVAQRQVGSATLSGVPEIPADVREAVQRYQNSRAAQFEDWLPDGSMLIATRFGATQQLHHVAEVRPIASCLPSGENFSAVSTPLGRVGCGSARRVMRSCTTTREKPSSFTA